MPKWWAAIPIAAVLLACGETPPEEKLREAVEPAGSWLAALELTGQKWLANSVPRSFVRSTLKVAVPAFTQVSEDVAKTGAPREGQAPLLQLVAAGRASAEALGRGVEGGNRQAVAREVEHLAALKRRLEALTQGSPP